MVGQLGNGTTGGSSATPLAVSNLNSVTALGAGSEYFCAIQGGDIFCWGNNAWGALGDGTIVNRNVPTKVVLP